MQWRGCPTSNHDKATTPCKTSNRRPGVPPVVCIGQHVDHTNLAKREVLDCTVHRIQSLYRLKRLSGTVCLLPSSQSLEPLIACTRTKLKLLKLPQSTAQRSIVRSIEVTSHLPVIETLLGQGRKDFDGGASHGEVTGAVLGFEHMHKTRSPPSHGLG